MRRFASRLRRLHPSWAATIALDVVLLCAFAIWYLWATSFASSAGRPSSHLFAVPGIAGWSGSRICIRGCSGHAIYGPVYVGPLTYAIVCLWAANCALLMAGAVWSFFRIEFSDDA